MPTLRLSSLVMLAVASAPILAAADPAPIAPIAPPAAAPDLTPSFEILDRGDAVEVIAHHIKAVRTAILPMRSRLEIPIATGPAARRLTPGDATVKLVELDGADASRMLSVKLGFERPDVKTLARYAQAIQVGDDLHVIVPRKVPTDGVAPKLPEPTIPPALAAAIAKVAPPATLGPRIDPAAKPEVKLDVQAIAKVEPIETKPEAKPDAKADAKPTVLGPSLPAPTAAATTVAKPAPAPATKPRADKPLKQVLAPEPDDVWSKISIYGALGLAALGAGIWLIRRRKGGHLAPHSSIEIIAQRSLGGKARIVWLSAGQREMIVSVTAQQVRMLGQWRKTDAAGMPTAQTYQDARPDARSEMMDRLLEKTRGAHDQVATDQPDNLSIANHLPRTERSTGPVILPERRTGQMAAVSQFTMPERRTGSFAAVDGRGVPPDGSAPGGGRGSIDKPSERRTGSFAAVDKHSERRTGSFAAVDRPTDRPIDRPVERALSPAVSGILRLRGRTGQMPAVSEAVATGDVEADELWAREILAATGARR